LRKIVGTTRVIGDLACNLEDFHVQKRVVNFKLKRDDSSDDEAEPQLNLQKSMSKSLGKNKSKLAQKDSELRSGNISMKRSTSRIG
jgi:hypothetical protein